jgi:hypothetical protein
VRFTSWTRRQASRPGGQDRVILRRRNARIIERDIDPPVPLRDRLIQALDIVLTGHVGRDERAAGLLRGRLARRLVDVDGNHDRPLGGQPARAGKPDAAARAGDDGDPVPQPPHARSRRFRARHARDHHVAVIPPSR